MKIESNVNLILSALIWVFKLSWYLPESIRTNPNIIRIQMIVFLLSFPIALGSIIFSSVMLLNKNYVTYRLSPTVALLGNVLYLLINVPLIKIMSIAT